MNIIIAGDGKVGSMLTRQLSTEGHNITVIDTNARVLEATVERYDVIGIHGNCASMDILTEAGVRDADLLIAATSEDEVNLLCCTTAHGMNPKLHTIARIRNPEYSDQIYKMRDVFGLSMSISLTPSSLLLRSIRSSTISVRPLANTSRRRKPGNFSSRSISEAV